MSRIKRSGGNKPLGKLNNAGFSLVEVLVAMAVLAILSVPVLSSFTNAARIAAREGSPITLIDGNELVRLGIRYEVYITPVKTYVLDEFYSTEE